MPKKTKEEAEKTRKRIIASALSLFIKNGYEHTTFSDIAARLKLTKGAVYWYFASKEALLVALVDMALERFRRQLDEQMPSGELTFRNVANMMVNDAVSTTGNPQSAAFFRLMKYQIRWSDASMLKVRTELLTDERFGPKEAFRKAVENDIAAGRIGPSVVAEEVAMVAIAIWDGLVQAKIDGFLTCDIKDTMEKAYYGMWVAMVRDAAGKDGGEGTRLWIETGVAN